MNRDVLYPKEYTKEISNNLDRLLIAINKVRRAYGKPMTVSSGWRPAAINAGISNAAKKSNHMLGLAVDIADPKGDVMRWVLANLKFVAECGLYVEDFRHTATWAHFQIVPPRSKKRIFIPSTAKAPAPSRWDGKYDTSLDG